MNLGSMLSAMYRKARYTSTPPAEVTQRMTDEINETHRELLAMPGIERLRDDVMPITALANQNRSGLPPSVARIQGITDRLNNHKLFQVPLAELRRVDPSLNFTSGYPLRYAVVGERQVQIQPSAATGLWAVSSSTADITQIAYVETITTGGYAYRDSKPLNGTTRVAFGTTSTRTDHIQVEKFYLGASVSGYVSLYDAVTAGNELARIAPGDTYGRYQTLEWHPTQTVDCTLYLDFQRTIYDLVNAFDEPLLPTDFHWVLVRGAMMREYEFIDDTRIMSARSDYERGQSKLRAFVLNDGDRVASLRPIGVKWSPLGGNYPAERWP